jgi:hypothetical protein
MAFKFAKANGNWTDTSVWGDDIVPLPDDVVYANSFNVTLDTDINVSTLRNDISPFYLPSLPIPVMTGNTSSSGTSSGGTFQNGFEYWRAFDQNASTSWSSNGGLGTTAWVSYQLTTPIVVKRYYIVKIAATTNRPSGWNFQASNDGSSWTTLETVTGDTVNTTYLSGVLPNTTAYSYYRIFVNTAVAGVSAQIISFEFTDNATASYGGANGGTFIVNTGRTITCTTTSTAGLVAGSTRCLTIQSTGQTININANVFYSTTTNFIATAEIPLSVSTGNTVNIVGTLTSTANRTIFNTNAPNTTISLTGTPNGNTGVALQANTTATNTNITVNGNVSNGISVIHYSTGSITINGDVIATGSSNIIDRRAASNITVNGNVYGAVSTGANGIIAQTVGGGQITVNGNVYGGNAYGILLSAVAATVTINGDVFAALLPAVGCSIFSTLPLRILGNMINSATTNAVWHGAVQLIGTNQYLQAKDASGNNKFLYSPGTNLGNPAISDVRSGVTYASGSLTGTLAVPNPSNVSLGVPTDNTFGTGIITVQNMGTLLTSFKIN